MPEMTSEQSTQAKKLAEEHWSYISKLLLTHGESMHNVDKIGFHYKSAMYHGIKHGCEDKEFNTTT